MTVQFVIFITIVLLVVLLCIFVVNPVAKKIAEKTPNKFDDLLVEKKFFSRIFQLVPSLVFYTGYPELVEDSQLLLDVCSRISVVWFSLIIFATGCAFLDVVESLNEKNKRTRNKSFHGTFQAVKLSMFCVSVVVVVSQVIGKSPVFVLSTLGAAATVLMLIFRDSILGVVSGIQINLSDLLRKGDWIEIERHHANGTVIDITLTSVKIRNWDKTISVIPAYDLITNSFRNWRGMEESGCRRIKRSLYIDQHSVRFLTEEEIERLSNLNLLKKYVNRKLEDGPLTNLGAFRAYCTLYLRSLSTISQSATLMTRQLAPTPEGLPLEIYAFTNVTQWVAYEGIQSDIFDHLIAILPEFGLEIFQYATIPHR